MLEKFNKQKQYRVTALNFLFGASLELLITACISISQVNKEDFMSFWSLVSTLLAFGTLIVLGVTPTFVYKASKTY